MKTLITLLTAVAMITACEHKNEISCSQSELSSNTSGCVCQLLAKKNSVNQEFKRSKNGLIIISQKLGSLD